MKRRGEGLPFRRQLDEQVVRAALDRNGGNQTRTATDLGISRRSLIDKLHKYGFGSKG